jgi:hypothetical protein
VIDTRLNTRATQLAAARVTAAEILARSKRTRAEATMRLGAPGGVKALLEQSAQERDSCVTLIEGVTTAAFEAQRDLSEQDNDTISRARTRIEFLDQQIERLSFDTQISDRARAALASNGVSGSQLPLAYRSAGEALYDLLHLGETASRQRLETEMHRAAQHMGADASNTVAVAGGLGSLVVKPVLGPLIDPTPAGRPFLTALGVMPLDTPLGFQRPRIVDTVQRPGHANYQDAPAPQGQEKSELVSRAFDIKLDSVESETVGEYLNVSQKLLSLPIGALQIILNQFTKRRSAKTEALAVAEILTSAATIDLDATPTGDESDAGIVWDAIWAAAGEVYRRTFALPSWLAMGPESWERIGRLRDRADRPLFPTIGATNAMGALSLGGGAQPTVNIGPAGLNVIVTPAITGPEMVVGNSAGLEVYEYAYPMLEAIEPAVLGRQLAVASEIAFYRPATEETAGSNAGTGNAVGNGAVIIRPPVGP